MMRLVVDEGYGWDYFSICMLKFRKGIITEAIYKVSELNLIQEFGRTKFEEIIASKEYDDLLLANSDTFDIVERAKENKVKASEVDACNYRRFLCKQALQRKFFPLSQQLEKKN